MNQNRKFVSLPVFQSALGLLVVILAWTICMPAQFGGNLNYVVITGNSMEPLFHTGDLVVTDKEPNYSIGDIVVYAHPQVGKVIHRIIGRDGTKFILQGDNNTWVDGYEPVREDILGKYWFSIPKAGTVFLKFRQPWLFAVLSGTCAMIAGVSMIKPPHRGRKNKMNKSGLMHDIGINISRWKDNYWLPVYILGLGCLILGIFSFTKPVITTVSGEILYNQSGQFSYSGNASQNIYDANAIQSGDPIFTSLTCQAVFSFEYLISAENPVTGVGDYQLSMVLTSPNGWSHTIDQTSLTEFEGNTFHTEKPLDLCAIQKYLTFVGSTTGIERQPYSLEIRPVINYSGNIDGNLFQAQFAPVLQFRVEEQQVFLVKDTSSEADPMVPAEEGVITVDHSVPNVINILGLKLPVRTGRIISILGFLLAAVGIVVPFICLNHAEKNDVRLKDKMILGQMMVEIHQPPVGAQDQVIDLSCLEDLFLIGEKTGSMVMVLYLPEAVEYYVQGDKQIYKFSKISPAR